MSGLQIEGKNSPKGFEKIDQVVVISALEAQMKYDLQSFSVKPNAKIKIIFRNPDSLPHNLIFCTPGKKKGGDRGQEVIDAVHKLGDKGVEMEWEPKGHPRILASSGMVQPGKEKTFFLKTPKKEGDFPYICTFPGHYQLMNGVMGVRKKANPITNLTYEIYHGEWSKLPEFSDLEPKKTGVLANGLFDISIAEVKDKFAFVFKGAIECPKDGNYSFLLSSDDGSKLLLNDKVLIDNDGVHGSKTMSGTTKLKKGKHKIEVRYFERGGGEELAIAWSGPGFKKQALSKKMPKVDQIFEGMLIEPPPGEAIIYRNFIEGAGPRAIGVGYQEGVNLAFDANNMRLAMIWHGNFMDGARHWIGRGQGNQPPAGSDVIRFPDGACFATLNDRESPWPEAQYRTKILNFKGYELDGSQKPTFKYKMSGISITDNLIPIPSSGDGRPGKIKRILKFESDDIIKGCHMLLGKGNFEKHGDFYQNEELSVRILGEIPFIWKNELRLPISLEKKRSKVEITYSWLR